mgnify:FL=1
MIKNRGLRFRRRLNAFLIIFILIFITGLISYQIYGSGTIGIINFSVSILSLTVAFIALIVSVNTYLSIDSVNDITKMDGNKLENENYITSISELVNMFDHKDSNEMSRDVFNELEDQFKKGNSRTAIELADNLQYFIDVIVIFPALFDSNNKDHKENMYRMENILNQINARKDDLLAISRGNLLLIEETVKLIEAVIHLQQFYHSNDSKKASKLLAVKGVVLKNSISKTVYYNYLALYYNKKAIEIIQNRLGFQGKDVFQIGILKEILRNKNEISLSDKELINNYLYEANRNIKMAKEHCLEDVMWRGFILYNEARIKFFFYIFSDENQAEMPEWLNIMDEAITTRKRINLLINDIVGVGNNIADTTFIQRHFVYQEYLASLVKVNILISMENDIETKVGKFVFPTYERLLEYHYVKNTFQYEFSKIEDYQEDIKVEINKLNMANI